MIKKDESRTTVNFTAKLKLNLTPEQKAALDHTALAYRDALNYASEVAFENGKTSNATKLQKLVYADLRERLGRDVPMEIRTIRLATDEEVELQSWHEGMVARERSQG